MEAELEFHETKTLPVVEIFGPTIQGEGYLTGHMTHFIRLGGCGYRCSWCDSMHAVEPDLIKHYAERLPPIEIIDRIHDLPGKARWVTISGGDPAIHDLTVLVRALRTRGFKVAVETQGQFYKSWLSYCDHVTISPKAPSSGMASKLDEQVLEQYVHAFDALDELNSDRYSFKVVCFDEVDVTWAAHLRRRFRHSKFYLSVGTLPNLGTPLRGDPDAVALEVLERYRVLIKQAQQQGLSDVAITPQMHVLLWGHKQGV